MSYSPTTNELKQLVDKHGLVIDYDPVLLVATIYGSELVNPIVINDAPVLVYELESELAQEIQTRVPSDIVKSAATSRDIKSFSSLYVASTQKYATISAFRFGKTGRIRLYGHEDLALISVIPGPKRVGFEMSGDTIKGTLQLGKKNFNLSSQVFLYAVTPAVDASKVHVIDDFVFDVTVEELKPSKIWATTYNQLIRHFTIEPLFSEASNE